MLSNYDKRTTTQHGGAIFKYSCKRILFDAGFSLWLMSAWITTEQFGY